MATFNFLDENGLLYFWQKIKTIFAKQSDLTALENTVSGLIAEGGEPNVIETIQVNGTDQAVSNKTVNISVPTNNNQLTNGAGYQTAAQVSSAISASGHQANVIESIKVNGTAQSISNKAVDITVPTNNNQLTNGAGYQTSSQVQSAISTAISGVTQFDFQIVASLPASGVKGTIYLVSNSGSGTNSYDEYIYVSNAWEKIGTTAVDLSGYVQSSDLVAITNSEIDTIVAS